MSTEYLISSKVIESGWNGSTIPLLVLRLASAMASALTDEDVDEMLLPISSLLSAC